MYALKLEIYNKKYRDDGISLILDIQNNEAKIDLPLREQPDLSDTNGYYRQSGGEFWVALYGGEVIGTVGIMLREKNCAVMKKFFVKKNFALKRLGLFCTKSFCVLS